LDLPGSFIIAQCQICTAYAHFGARFGAFFYCTSLFENIVPLDNTHSNLSDQFALEIIVRISVRLRVALF